MIEYIIPNNPDDRILERACALMRDGGLICFPTDTHWAIACDSSSKKGVDALYRIKDAGKGKHFSMLCNNISQASKYGLIYDSAFRMLRKSVPGPYTFIFTPTKELPRTIRGYKKEKEIGIRIPNTVFCQRMVETNGEPLLTTSLTADMIANTDAGAFLEEGGDIYSYQIEEAFGHILKMIIDPGDFEFHGESSVVSFATEDEIPVVIREGAGDISPFV